jgi:hypothetical protein
MKSYCIKFCIPFFRIKGRTLKYGNHVLILLA